MDPCTIRQVTLYDSTAAYLWRLLYASRYLQVPQGRAFLLAQLRHRLAMLPIDTSTCAATMDSTTRAGDFLATFEAACAGLHTSGEPAPPLEPPLPPLTLDWPSEKPPLASSGSAAIATSAPAYPPPIIILGDFLDIIT